MGDTTYAFHRNKRLAVNRGPVCPDRELLLRGILERATAIERLSNLAATDLERKLFDANRLANEIIVLADEALSVPGTVIDDESTEPEFVFEPRLAKGTADLPQAVAKLARETPTKPWR